MPKFVGFAGAGEVYKTDATTLLVATNRGSLDATWGRVRGKYNTACPYF